MQRRMEYLQQRRDWSQVPSGPPPGWDEAIPEVRRFFTTDPWGNRLELLSPVG